MQFLSALTSQVAIAIHHYRLYEQAKGLAVEFEKENRRKDEFLRNLSYDLRQPLTSVMGYAGLIQDRMMGKLTPPQDNALTEIMKSSHDVLTTINQTLEAVKREALKDEVLKGSRSLSEAVDEFEWDFILKALQRTGFNETKAAALLGTTRRILHYRIEKLKATKNKSATGA